MFFSINLDSEMKTVYLKRDTEDPHEDMDVVPRKVDLFMNNNSSLGYHGLGTLATLADHLL